jgi:hypothetical protein
MTEERKHAILFAVTLLCARKLIDCIESDKPNFAKEYFVDKAIREAEFVLDRIDKRWPVGG